MIDKKRGRHPLPERLKKKEMINFYLIEKDRKLLEKIAKEAEKDLSVYIREDLIIPLLKDKEKENE